MKGLLRNNFYSVESNLKMAVLLSLAAMICCVIGSILYQNSSLLTFILLGQMILFIAQPGSALQKDLSSKWSKFEITMPVKRKDIINARYLSFVIYGLMGIAISVITVMFVYLAGIAIDFERLSFVFTVGIMELFMAPAFMYPLILKFGADKSEIILFISILLSIGLFVALSAILLPFISELSNVDLIIRSSSIVLSIIAFILSYFISLNMYKKKEL